MQVSSNIKCFGEVLLTLFINNFRTLGADRGELGKELLIPVSNIWKKAIISWVSADKQISFHVHWIPTLSNTGTGKGKADQKISSSRQEGTAPQNSMKDIFPYGGGIDAR